MAATAGPPALRRSDPLRQTGLPAHLGVHAPPRAVPRATWVQALLRRAKSGSTVFTTGGGRGLQPFGLGSLRGGRGQRRLHQLRGLVGPGRACGPGRTGAAGCRSPPAHRRPRRISRCTGGSRGGRTLLPLQHQQRAVGAFRPFVGAARRRRPRPAASRSPGCRRPSRRPAPGARARSPNPPSARATSAQPAVQVGPLAAAPPARLLNQSSAARARASPRRARLDPAPRPAPERNPASRGCRRDQVLPRRNRTARARMPQLRVQLDRAARPDNPLGLLAHVGAALGQHAGRRLPGLGAAIQVHQHPRGRLVGGRELAGRPGPRAGDRPVALADGRWPQPGLVVAALDACLAVGDAQPAARARAPPPQSR